MLEHDTDVWDSLLRNVGTIVGYIGVALTAIAVSRLKEWLSVRHARRSTRRAVDNSVVLSGYLGEIRALTDADRVVVMQFHNGDHFASGASVQKITVTHCILRAGVSMPTNVGGDSLHYFPATYMTHLLDESFKRGFALYHEEKEAEDHWVQRYFVVNGVNTEVVCLIPGANPQEGFGLLCFSWLEPKKISKAVLDEMMDFAKRTAAHL